SSSSSLRPEPSGARALAPSAPPSVDLSPSATTLRFLAQEPSSAPPPPSLTPRPASYGRNHPRHRRSPWEALEALLHRRSASPVVLRSNRPQEWIRGEFLVLPGLFPLPWCVAGAVAAALAAACGAGQKLCIADGPPGRRRQSAGQIRFHPETMLSLVV